jgi:hypothetical protein
MLKEPYKLILKKGINRYYTLKVNNVDYFATETVVKLDKEAKKNSQYKEFTQALKVLPLTAPILFLIIAFLKNETLGEKEDTFGDKEMHFKKLDVTKVKDRAFELFSKVENNYHFPDIIDNPTIDTLTKKDSYEIYCAEEHSKHVFSTWLVYTSERGLLRLHEVITSGDDGFKNVLGFNSYVLDKEIALELISKIKNDELN